jgi:capsular polysaccharide biosynthesis protein
MEEIDLRDILGMLIKRWYIVLISVIICSSAAVLLSLFVLKPVYQSNTTLYIGKNMDGEKTDLAYNDVMLGSYLVKDYREIVKSRLVARQVIEELKLKDMTVDDLIGKLSVDLKNDTRVIQISASDNSPEMSSSIANKVAEVFMTKVVDIMKVENVKVIDTAEVPKNPVKPNKRMNVAIGFLLGLMLGFGIIFIIEYFDNTIKTADDIKKYVDLPVIGTIPAFPEN